MVFISLYDPGILKNVCHTRRLLLAIASRMTVGFPLCSLYAPQYAIGHADHS
jgi:hypothetical protein